MPTIMCHCGQPLHYDRPAHRKAVEKRSRESGPYVVCTGSDGRRWRVQRHYLVLHGITLGELPALGFEEVK